MTRLPAVLLAAAMAGACGAGAAGNSAATPAADTVSVVGVVEVVGADPLTQVVVRSSEGERTQLVGPLRVELAQAVGVEARVTGVAADPMPPARAAVSVQSYELVTLNGVPVYVGRIERVGDAAWLVSSTGRWQLVGAPEELLAAQGAKAWVVGELQGDRLPVTAYGVLKPPGSP